MPPPSLTEPQRRLLQEFHRIGKLQGPETYVSPISLATGIGLDVGDAGAAIAGLFVKDLIELKEAQSGRLSRDGLMLAAEFFEP